jgi:hypothetical protein
LPEDPAKGAVTSRDTINQLLYDYYELRGWNKRLGLLAGQKLRRLGLRDVANELLELGKIPWQERG